MIGDRIKKARETAGFTQDEFCKLINKSKRTLLNYEKNESEPSVNVVLEIAKICNTDKIWLLTGSKESDINPDELKEFIAQNLDKLNEQQLQFIYNYIQMETSK